MSEFNLESVLLSNPLNFESFELHSGFLVVDGDDFIYFLSELFGAGNCDDECLQFSVEAHSIISLFQRSNVDAIFLFEGVVPERAYATSERRHTSAAHPMAQQTLLNVLKYYGVQRVFLNEPICRAVCSLAGRLQCPFTGSKDAYYLMACDKSVPLSLVPLHLLLPETVPAEFSFFLSDDNRTNKVGISTYAFYPQATDFVRLVSESRRLFAVAWDFGLMYTDNKLVLVKGVKPQPDNQSRFECLLQWAQENSEDLVAQITSVLFDGSVDQWSETRASYICAPHTVGERIRSLIESTVMTNDAYRLDLSNVKSMEEIPVTAMDSTTDVGELALLSGWPPGLTAAYRRGDIPLALIAYLYLPVCARQRVRLQPVEIAGIQLASPLTVLSARILVGMEQQIRNEAKLQGLYDERYSLVLGSPQSSQAVSVVIEPYLLNFRQDRTDTVLCQLFGLPEAVESLRPDWLLSIAFTVGFWRCHISNIYPSTSHASVEPVYESPFLLSLLSVTIATVYNIDHSHRELRAHYCRVSQFAASELATSIRQHAGRLDSSVREARGFQGIQVIYQALHALVTLVDGIVHPTAVSNVFKFLPCWIMFPSETLVYTLMDHLQLQIPTVRQDLAKQFWLPKITLSSHSKNVDEARDVFDRLLQLSSVLVKPDAPFLEVSSHLSERLNLHESRTEATLTPLRCRTRYSGQSNEENEMWARGKVVHDCVSPPFERRMDKTNPRVQRIALFELSNCTPRH